MEIRERTTSDDDNQANGSLLSLWNIIVPKISMARKIVFSAVSDILERQNFEVQEQKKSSLRGLQWKNTEKSVWTLSTLERITGLKINKRMPSKKYLF